MIYVRVFDYKRHADYGFHRFVVKHADEILTVTKQPLMVWLKNGDEVHFVPKSSFNNWRRGRKYTIEQWGTLYEEGGYE